MNDLFEKTKERVRGKVDPKTGLTKHGFHPDPVQDAKPVIRSAKGAARREQTERPNRERTSPDRGQLPAAQVESRAVAVASPPTNILAAIIGASQNDKLSVEKMEMLRKMRREVMEEQAETAFEAAFVRLRADLPVIRKDGKIEIEGRSGKRGGTLKYASYENVMMAIQPHLTKHQFEIHLSTRPNANGEGHHIHGELVHVCDTNYGPLVWRKETHMPAVIEAGGAKNNAQGIGSGLTYARRYAVRDLVNLISFAAEDRDTDGKPRLPTVDAEQCAAVKAAIKFCGADEAEFCKHYGIDKVENLLAEHYGEALDACKRRKEKLDAAQAS